MDDKSLSDQLSNLFPAPDQNAAPPDEAIPSAERGFLVDSLKTLAGQAGEGAQPVLDQFLSGQGELAEVTRAAAASGSTSALNKVINLLTTTLKLSPAIARIIAPILLKLAPSLGNQAAAKETEKEPAEKKKPRRKTAANSKKETSSKKKADKKTSSKPKKTPAKPAAKKKPAAKAKKETAAAKKRKTAKKSVTVETE